MAIEVACPYGARFQVPDHLTGKSSSCRKCGNQLLHTAANAPVLPPLSTPSPPIPPAVPQPTVNPAQYRINSPARYTNSNKCWVLIAATVVIIGLATTVFLVTQYNQNPESVGTPGLKSADGSDYSDQSMPDGMAQQNSAAVSEADAIYFEDHPLLLNALKTLASDHAVEFEELSTIEVYEAFVRSPEYQQWLQFQNQLQL